MQPFDTASNMIDTAATDATTAAPVKPPAVKSRAASAFAAIALSLVLAACGGGGGGTTRAPVETPGFFMDLRRASVLHYGHYLRIFERYLGRIGVRRLAELSPPSSAPS